MQVGGIGVASQDMIAKMKASILHQARTTAQAIQEQAAQDADHLRTTQRYSAQMKINEESQFKEKQIRAQTRVHMSIVKGQEGMRMLAVQSKAVERARDRAVEKLKSFVATPAYAEVLIQICVEGVVILNEDAVELAVRERDVKTVTEALGRISREAQAKLQHDVVVKVSSEYQLPDAAIGGCVSMARDGGLQCSNTLLDRAFLATSDLYPQIRRLLVTGGAKGTSR